MHAKWASAFDAACRVVDGGGILAVLGDRGNGKSQLGTMLVRRYCLECKSCRYVRARGIALRVRQAYDPHADVTEQHAIGEFTGPHLLVVDEIQELATTDFTRDTLTYILDVRYGRCVPTVLIANATEEGFRKIIGAAIEDRLREGGGILVFDWPSFRRQTPPTIELVADKAVPTQEQAPRHKRLSE